MAASAFTIFREAKRNLGLGNLTLNSGVLRLVLVQSGATLLSANTALSTKASLSTAGVQFLDSGGNYSLSGTTLASPTWSLSGTTMIFDATDWSLSANGVDHLSIVAAMIKQSASDRIICFATLTSAGVINVSAGNKLIIQFNASGIFTLA